MVCSISRQNFSNIIGEREKKLIIAKLCGYEKLYKKYTKVVPVQIPCLFSVTY